MSEALVIPEDLREMYAVAVTHRHNYGSKPKYGSGTVEVLIERIARLKAENAALSAQVERQGAPVSDEEMIAHQLRVSQGWSQRKSMDALVASRKEPAK